MSRNRSIARSIDWWTILMWVVMMVFGWINIYAATYNEATASWFSLNTYAGKQFMWIGVSLVLGIVLMLIDHKTYDVLAYFIYFFWIIVLIGTRFLAHNVKGSYSWIQMGPISLQPAEFAKCFTALALAKYMSKYDFKMKGWRNILIPMAIIAVPALIIMVWQNETGSALVFAAFLFMLYREGMSSYVLLIAAVAIVLFVVVIKFNTLVLPLGIGTWGVLIATIIIIAIAVGFLLFKFSKPKSALILTGATVTIYGAALIVNIWKTINFEYVSIAVLAISAIYITILSIIERHRGIALLAVFIVLSGAFSYSCNIVLEKVLKDHQRKRIEIILGITEDPAGVGYNAHQAEVAIGSGGFTGKGFLKGTQTTLNFVPEQHTDFIFTTIGEEWGFIGAVCVLALYFVFIMRLIYLAERQKDMFSQIYGYSVAMIIMTHVLINIGMVIGLLPVIGIPLPFYSYGGSQTIGFTLLLFIFLKLDAARVEKL